MGDQCKLLEPSGHVVGHLKALNVKSTEFLVCFHSTSSLLLFHLKSIWKTCFLNLSFQVFVYPKIHFQCQIFNVNIVSSFFLIVFELFLNKKGKCMIFFTLQTIIRQLFYPNLKLFLQRMVLLEFCLNLNKSAFSATTAATAD